MEQLNFYHIRVSAQKVYFFTKVLEQLGVDKAQIFAELHDLPNLDSDNQATISGKQLIQIYQNINRLNLPGIGLKIGAEIRAKDYGMYGCTLSSCQTLAESLDFATRYHSLATRTTRLYYDVKANGSSFLGCDDILGQPELKQFNLELQAAIHLALIRDAIGHSDFSPSKVYFEFAEPAHSSLYYKMFDCPIVFEQAVSGFEFDQDKMATELARYNPLALPILLKSCDQLLELVTRDKFLLSIYSWVANNVDQELQSQPLAEHLCMTTRTLRRHLAEHGTSFNKICAEVKCRFAKKYIDDDKLSIDDIASALGFKDSANFRRAFKSWTGLTPSEYRRDCQDQDSQWSKS
ncbi:AraC family transcriptional regulator [Endozoicomonas sp. G2_1]|uniref:AraC family transcriptional regulator n=1 Tax=Endozoicomonas sp. G2_1 TaxID=2821091 RepID=UPI001ADAD21E|nr:AraC family transcriptional regulator [Endozoicomonas sp. G2_1]MBO9491651.1 AraC family transcriptional regulator [Endozoicomonas sp. G2_1]